MKATTPGMRKTKHQAVHDRDADIDAAGFGRAVPIQDRSASELEPEHHTQASDSAFMGLVDMASNAASSRCRAAEHGNRRGDFAHDDLAVLTRVAFRLSHKTRRRGGARLAVARSVNSRS
jgi:hypothetical protein